MRREHETPLADLSLETARAIRSRLQGRTGLSFWRGLEELSQMEDFRLYLEAEFPSIASLQPDRRSLLKAMGASLALSGLAGCGQADDRALPYTTAPEFLVQGNAKWYATAVTLGGYAQPVLGKTYDGRPVKLEGNPDHPRVRGGSDAFMQAALLGLYDPDRSRAPRHLGRTSTWAAFEMAMAEQATRLDANQGEGFRLLTGTITSPTMTRQIGDLLRRWPRAQWHVLEPVNEDLRQGAIQRVFGRPLDQHLLLDQAETVISFDDDFLGSGPRQVGHGRLWASRRTAFQNGEGDCRLMMAEPTPSLTGAIASERLIAAHGRIGILLRSLAAALGLGDPVPNGLSAKEKAWVDGALRAVQAHRGRSLIAIGPHHAPELQVLTLLLNERLGHFGKTIRFTEPVPVSSPGSFASLLRDLAAGQVSVLAMLDTNPAYTCPGHVDFAKIIAPVKTLIHAGLHHDETAALSHWHVPLPHDLESWSDARGVDGLVSLIQPLIRPFYDVRSAHVVLQNLLGQPGGSDHDIVQATWRAAWGDAFQERWTQSLQRGFIEDSAPAAVIPNVADFNIPLSVVSAEEAGLTVVFRPDPTVWDGRFANNAWLQELPKPLTKITWDNVILISPRLAQERGIKNGDALRLEAQGDDATGAAWIMPGQEARTVTVTLGYGRGPTGRVMDRLGYDAYRLRHLDDPWSRTDVTLHVLDKQLPIATTQLHGAMNGSDFVRVVTMPDQDASKGSDSVPKGPDGRPPSFYASHVSKDSPSNDLSSSDPSSNDPSWGMSIDLDLCIGCNACVVACVSENNIPMVGKELVAEGREMHWLRIDRYYDGEPEEPNVSFQPVPCMHCEQAPCEMGCPVNAAVHSYDGLNLQVYNRCIGTRTCSSYCPYKVRRFNWFDFTQDDPPEMRAARNPNVTVRSRGVMEKCTYCVQRISDARILAKKENRPLRDGEVVTACQQACPTSAITFGDVHDPSSQVSERKASPRDYSLLEEINTRPRTTYLARIANGSEGQGG